MHFSSFKFYISLVRFGLYMGGTVDWTHCNTLNIYSKRHRNKQNKKLLNVHQRRGKASVYANSFTVYLSLYTHHVSIQLTNSNFWSEDELNLRNKKKKDVTFGQLWWRKKEHRLNVLLVLALQSKKHLQGIYSCSWRGPDAEKHLSPWQQQVLLSYYGLHGEVWVSLRW